MAGNGGFGDDDLLSPGCYSELLFSDEIPGLDGLSGGFTSSFSGGDDRRNGNAGGPKMLCFGDYGNSRKMELENAKRSKPAACTGSNISPSPKSNKKRDGSRVQTNARATKKSKSSTSCTVTATPTGHPKVVKKEKLGERITALQQLVSPFGKLLAMELRSRDLRMVCTRMIDDWRLMQTDTASVLHEALGYIRFLQEQVQVLCSPYLQRWSASKEGPPPPPGGDTDIARMGLARKGDLRSRGLCLVPVELTVHVAESNGADLWSSTAMIDTVYSS